MDRSSSQKPVNGGERLSFALRSCSQKSPTVGNFRVNRHDPLGESVSEVDLQPGFQLCAAPPLWNRLKTLALE